MTDRLKGFVVVLEEDLPEDDAEPVLSAIRMVKGVVSVKPVIARGERRDRPGAYPERDAPRHRGAGQAEAVAAVQTRSWLSSSRASPRA
jgi:hypothetical protein